MYPLQVHSIFFLIYLPYFTERTPRENLHDFAQIFLGEWDALYNPNFNYTEFGTIRNMAGSNNFVLSVKTWIERTNAIGIVAL